jgi:hypothetical protein
MSAHDDAGAATAALETLVRMIAKAVVAELRSADAHSDMIDQTRSPLSAKKHCAIVRARLGRSAGGVAIAGRKHLITRAALQEELDALSARRRTKPAAPIAAPADDLASYLERYGVRKAG